MSTALSQMYFNIVMAVKEMKMQAFNQFLTVTGRILNTTP